MSRLAPLCAVACVDEPTAPPPDLTAILAFPTTVFVGRDGRVRAIHSGFDGPATGERHVQLVARMERLIEDLLDGTEPGA